MGWFGHTPGSQGHLVLHRPGRWWRRWRTRARSSTITTRFVDEVDVVTDPAPAAWIPAQVMGWGRGQGTRVGAVVPTGYEAYARVFHPVTVGPDTWRSWTQVARDAGRHPHARMQWEAITRDQHGSTVEVGDEPDMGSLPQHQARVLVEVLRRHTDTPQSCWLAVWDGYGDLPDTDASRLELPGRDHVVLAGRIDAAAHPLWVDSEAGHGHYQSPNLWWPEDRAWVVGTEIDFRWTYVAGSAACIRQLVDDERLEAYEVGVHDRGDIQGDDVNPLPDEFTRPREAP